MKLKIIFLRFVLILMIITFSATCKKHDPVPVKTTLDEYDPLISDSYSDFADISLSYYWGSYNLHDPTIIREGNQYYIFSTDVMYGPLVRSGIMYRKSTDLVHWNFLGWVFNGVPSAAKEYVTTTSGGLVPGGVWAPYILKVGTEFRLYYSVSANGLKVSCIALATSTSLDGPWTDQGIVISTTTQDQMNSIDPSVIVDRINGKHWMSYGSWFAGIFMVELNPATGKLKTNNDSGHLIAFRKKYMDAIEGCEIMYNPELNKYFLFVSYDGLEDTYNVRVGRSENPEGPYFDINDNIMASAGDNLPMITAQYQFNNHSGWQGFGHCGILADSSRYFYVSQGRLGANKYFMDLHVHRMVWTPSGWPVISPERFAALPQTEITTADLQGKWEHIDLNKTISKNQSIEIELKLGGSIAGVTMSTWSYQNKILTLSFNNNSIIYKALVMREWDWENKKRTIVYTGMTSSGYSGWGKKI
jgi:arabinan endo-1,5-alpha-L-arabinosidase